MNKKYLLLVFPLIIVLGAYIKFRNNLVPSVKVVDQVIQNNQVVVAEVVAPKPSWLVIQTEVNGIPGPVIGYTKINKGKNSNVAVEVDTQKISPRLFAMIHDDDGKEGVFDFPENDMPLLYNEEMVSQLFAVR